MKTFEITKQRAGQDKKSVLEIYANDFEGAKKEFISKMTSNLFFDEETNSWKDECGNEVWGFSDDNTRFSEDVYTWELKEV